VGEGVGLRHVLRPRSRMRLQLSDVGKGGDTNR
jgi:hypothetical protein